MPEPLDTAERAFARLMQIALRMVKRCESCGAVKPVTAFARYRDTACTTCHSTPAIRTGWREMRRLWAS